MMALSCGQVSRLQDGGLAVLSSSSPRRISHRLLSQCSLPSYGSQIWQRGIRLPTERACAQVSLGHNRIDDGGSSRWGQPCRCTSSSASAAGADMPLESDSSGAPESTPQETEARRRSLTSVWKNWQTNASDMRAQVAKLGLAAVLAYGLFDGVTYTSFFVLAFLGYEKSTGQNPAANLKALLGIVVLMWTGNNVTRPLRVAGAAALAPLIDRFLKKTQEVLKLPNQLFAFMIVVASFASLCFSVVGLLILSRWGK